MDGCHDSWRLESRLLNGDIEPELVKDGGRSQPDVTPELLTWSVEDRLERVAICAPWKSKLTIHTMQEFIWYLIEDCDAMGR